MESTPECDGADCCDASRNDGQNSGLGLDLRLELFSSHLLEPEGLEQKSGQKIMGACGPVSPAGISSNVPPQPAGI